MKSPALPGVLGWLVAGAAAAAIVVGYAMVGSPAAARARRLDDRRVSDLATVAALVDLHWTRSGGLPQSARDADTGIAAPLPVDPETGRPYEYRVLGADRFELCATFALASGAAVAEREARFWSHDAGRQCFVLEPKTVRR